MKKVLVSLATGVFLIALTVCLACAQGPQGPGPGHPGMGMEMEHPLLWLDLPRLNIDKNRMDAIREIEGKALKDGIRKRAELQVASIELGELLAKDPVDMRAVETKLKQIEALRTDMQFSRIKAIEEIKGKLTSEERKKLKEFIETVHMRPPLPWDELRGHGPGDQPPAPKKPLDAKKAPRAKERVR